MRICPQAWSLGNGTKCSGPSERYRTTGTVCVVPGDRSRMRSHGWVAARSLALTRVRDSTSLNGSIPTAFPILSLRWSAITTNQGGARHSEHRRYANRPVAMGRFLGRTSGGPTRPDASDRVQGSAFSANRQCTMRVGGAFVVPGAVRNRPWHLHTQLSEHPHVHQAMHADNNPSRGRPRPSGPTASRAATGASRCTTSLCAGRRTRAAISASGSSGS